MSEIVHGLRWTGGNMLLEALEFTLSQSFQSIAENIVILNTKIAWDILTLKNFTVSLKFKFNWLSCIFICSI